MKLLLFTLLGMLALSYAAEDYIIEEEFSNISCGSSIKLKHGSSGYRLHSHSIAYGSGSGQNSVTGFPNGDDPNSYFVVYEAFGDKQCRRGVPIECGGTVRLKHLETKRFLHSHLHTSPLSNQQEVSCYSDTLSDTGDNWKVVCLGSEKMWKREKEVRLQHVVTSKYLSCSKSHQFRHPIPGQLEIVFDSEFAIAGASTASADTKWTVEEGIFFGIPE
ncbi:hypothetical protein SmJEL517_g05537 [Synchytrium microbalum]|uniref:MIR domain-containing protein n=1 Tax=Synchytrium microbalum TaxID=1806994 RepID=A0A507C0A4_9FUNG|nr:uncharacterized protein SmJEL517_g05537 [Synchytrium microbalum]TPX31015.1 hypothetical protein SmJEL517_g05537 [Synchytrium microbalum]